MGLSVYLLVFVKFTELHTVFTPESLILLYATVCMLLYLGFLIKTN